MKGAPQASAARREFGGESKKRRGNGARLAFTPEHASV
jgi:hypothetical protein